MDVPIAKKEAVRHRPGVLTFFAGVVCFFALIQFFCVFASITGIDFSRPVAVGVLVLSLIVSVLFSSRFLDQVEVTPPNPEGFVVKLLKKIPWLIGVAVILWAGFVWFQLWKLAWIRPPYDWDGLYYHLPAIHEWIMAGRVMFIGNMPYVPYANFPMGVELFSFFAYFLLGTDKLVNGCNLWYWPLAFLALAVIASRLGARGVWRLVAGALIVGVPVFVCQSASCYIDPGFASAVMAAIAAACVFLFDKKRPARWNAVLLGAAVGLALGSKGTGVPHTVAFMAAVLCGAFVVHGSRRWKQWLPRFGLVVLVTLLVGGYWYVRNTIRGGNPVYPIQVKFGEKVLIEGWDHVAFNNANLPPWLKYYPNWQRMFVSWTQPDAPVSGYAPVGGMGYIWLAGGIPAFLLLWIQFLRRRSRYPVNEFAFLTALVLLLLIVTPATWWARFTIWLHALGLPCIAVVLYRAINGLRRNPWHLVTIVLAFCIIGVAVTESNTTLALEKKDGLVTEAGGDRGEYMSSLDYILPGLSETPGFQDVLTAEKIARSPWNTDYGTLLGGVLTMPLGKREIRVLPYDPTENDIDDLRQAGVEWIVWDLLATGEVPEVVNRNARDVSVFNSAPDVNFHIVRLK